MSQKCHLTVYNRLNKEGVTFSKERFDGLRCTELSIRDSSSVELVIYLKNPRLYIWIFDDKDRKCIEELAIIIHLHRRRKRLNA